MFNKSRQPDAANMFAPSRARNVSRIMIAGPIELRRRDSNKPTTNERLCSIIRGGPGVHVPPPPSPVPLLCHFLAQVLIVPFFQSSPFIVPF